MEWIQAQNGDSREFLAASPDCQYFWIMVTSTPKLTSLRCSDELVLSLPRLTLPPCSRWTPTLRRLLRRSGRSLYHANLIRGKTQPMEILKLRELTNPG